MDNEPRMVEELRMVRMQKGMHRPASRSDPAWEREMAFTVDGNDLGGINESRPPTQEEIEERSGSLPAAPLPAEEKVDVVDTILGILEIVNDVGVPLYLNHIRPWWQKAQAEREVKRVANKVPGRRYVENAAEPVLEPPPTMVPTSTEVDAIEERVEMTRQEFQQTLVLTLAAQRFADRGKDVLSRATIVDDPLTPQLRAAINLVLAGNVDQLDNEMKTLLAAFFRELQLMDAEGRLMPEIQPAADQVAASTGLPAGSGASPPES